MAMNAKKVNLMHIRMNYLYLYSCRKVINSSTINSSGERILKNLKNTPSKVLFSF